ncbi:unnamed protein product [Sphagnum balticum]
MPHCRANYAMTLVNNGASLNRNNNRNSDVLVCGGSYDAFGFLSTCILYLSNFNVWLQFPSLPKTMKWFPMVTLQGGRVVDDNKRRPHSRRAKVKAWSGRTTKICINRALAGSGCDRKRPGGIAVQRKLPNSPPPDPRCVHPPVDRTHSAVHTTQRLSRTLCTHSTRH